MNTNNKPGTILIIDKYNNTLAKLMSSLEDLDFNIIIANSFADSTKALEYHGTDILCAIINVIEPLQDDIFDSLSNLLSIKESTNTPLIVFTSKLSDKKISKFYDTGIFQLIEKPCSNEHLTRTIVNIAELNSKKKKPLPTTDAYKAILDNTPIEIATLDSEYKILEWNKSFEKRHPTVATEQNYFSISCGDNYIEISEHPVTLAKENLQTEHGTIITTHDHKKHYDNIIATPILNSTNKIKTIIVQSLNQTSQISMEQKLRRQVQRYNRILKEQDRTTDYLIRTQKDLQEKGIELERLSTTDSLTGVSNRRKLDQDLKSESLRAARYKHPLTLMMIDIDNFKKVNDTYGHLTGDIILKSLAQIVQSTIRETDNVARYGGEEFVIILPETEYDTATIIAERLRYNIEQNKVATEYGELSITVSIGVASIFSDNITPHELLKESDTCLYQAKESGKNCIASIEIKD